MYDVAIIGGGPAGSSAAITAARNGARVLLLERSHLPRHKVCGEFISAESIQLLGSLLQQNGSLALLSNAPRVTASRIFINGDMLQARLPGTCAGIQRHDLDWALWQAAQGAGADCRMRVSVERIARESAAFFLASTAGDFQSRAVIDASGRWSNLRPVSAPAKFWVGIKAHFRSSNPAEPDSVDLYFFRQGYCGVQRVGSDVLNLCAMVRDSELASSREQILQRLLASHPGLQQRSSLWQRCTDIVTTSPLVFRRPVAQRGAVLCAGDAAGFIDPFAGDGISLALKSGVLAADCLVQTWKSAFDVNSAATQYADRYARVFAPLFRKTAILRRMSRLPRPIQTALLPIFRRHSVTDYLVRVTRPQ